MPRLPRWEGGVQPHLRFCVTGHLAHGPEVNKPCGHRLLCHPACAPGSSCPGWGLVLGLASPQEERGRAPAGHPLPFPTVHALLHAPDTPEMAPRPCCPAPSSGSQTLGPGHTTRSLEARAPAEGTPCPRARLPSVRMGRRVTGVIKTRLASTGRCGPAQGRAPGSATPRPTHRPPVPLAGCIIQVGSWCRGVWEAPRSSLTRGRHPVCSRQVRSGLGRACWLAPSWSRHPFPAGRGLPYGSSALGPARRGRNGDAGPLILVIPATESHGNASGRLGYQV